MRGVLGTFTVSGWVARTAGGGTITGARPVRTGSVTGGVAGLEGSVLEPDGGLAPDSMAAVGRTVGASHWLRWSRNLWTSVALTAICWRSLVLMRSNLIGVCWDAA